LVRWLIKPNLALQALTTREPDPSMLEVAIASFQAMQQAEREFVTSPRANGVRAPETR
jgi:uncharacterized protein YqhQ